MRRGSNPEWLMNGDQLVGLCLGADYCAEHEWGIKGIRRAFGMTDDETVFGIDRRRVTIAPEMLIHHRGKHSFLARLERWWNSSETAQRYADWMKHVEKGELHLWGDGKLATAWNEGTFGIHAIDAKKHVDALHDALVRKDAAIWLGGGGVFQNSGLVIAIASMVPVEGAETMRAADEENATIKRLAAETGIEERLKKAGKKWFALSPGRVLKSTVKGEVKTKHPVMFWLNPQEHDIHNYGWFTVEDLEQWAENRGPCMGGRRARQA